MRAPKIFKALESGSSRTCVVIFGPHSAGKMTVGQELSMITGFPFLHHRVIHDVVASVWGDSLASSDLLRRDYRNRIFQDVATGDANGFVFSCVWDFDDAAHCESIDEACGIFRRAGWKLAFVELAASLRTRVLRNRPPLRTLYDCSRMESDSAAGRPLRWALGRFNSGGDFPYPEEHFVVSNDDLAPDAVAQRVIDAFDLQPRTRTAALLAV